MTWVWGMPSGASTTWYPLRAVNANEIAAPTSSTMSRPALSGHGVPWRSPREASAATLVRSPPSASRSTEPAWVARARTSPPAAAARVHPSARGVPAGRARRTASSASGTPSTAPTAAMATDSPATIRPSWGIEAPRSRSRAISRRRRSERSATTSPATTAARASPGSPSNKKSRFAYCASSPARVSAVPRLSPTRAPPATAAWKWLARPWIAMAALWGSDGRPAVGEADVQLVHDGGRADHRAEDGR